MLTVSYFCKATEIRFLNDKIKSINGNLNNLNIKSVDDLLLEKTQLNQGEFLHNIALKISTKYLPNTSPIVKHFVSSFKKHFSCNLDIIVNIKKS